MTKVEAQQATAASLPTLRGNLIGRGEAIQALKAQFAQHRFVSIVGPGGMGKTSLAIAVARELAAERPDGVYFVDLARHASAAAMTQQLAVALSLEASLGDAMPALVEKLRGKRLLIVLDCCEVAIDAAAGLAEAVIAASPLVQVLATSREALNAVDEWVCRIEPLGCPPAGELPTWLLASYPALQLFASVVRESEPAFTLDPEQADRVSTICRRLDGNPLAIALAASRVTSLGLDGVAEQIDRAVLDWRASPQAQDPARHQSLEAVLDWSFHLLNPAEQRIFCCLSVFRSNFDLNAAVAVAGDSTPDAAGTVLDLLSKSLLVMHEVGGEVCYRFLDTTRSYAERALTLMAPAEIAACRLRHAALLVRLLREADKQWELMAVGAWRRRYGAWIEDVRIGLEWAFADGGDIDMGVKLTLASVSLMDQTSLMRDYGRYAHRALIRLQSMDQRHLELEMRLLATPVLHQLRDVRSQGEALSTLTKAREIGLRLGVETVPAQLGCLLALWAQAFQAGNYREAMQRTGQMQELADAHADRVAAITAMRTRAQNLHFLGDQAGAQKLALRVCALQDQKLPLAYMPSPVSMAVSMRILRVRMLWLQGQADRAWNLVEECLRLAEDDHPTSLCQTWAVAQLPLAIWCGRSDEAERGVEALGQLARRFAHPYWAFWSQMFGVILRGAVEQAPEGVLQIMRSPDQVMLRDHLGTFQLGELAPASFERASSGEVGWCAPEALRVRAERLWASDGQAAAEQVRGLLERAGQLAQSQGALAWELRVAMSGFRMEQQMGEPAAAMLRLETIRHRFAEGLDTRDLRAADRLLDY